MNSTVGRPRQVTDAQVEAIMHWYYSRKRISQLARELGLSVKTVEYVIRIRGQYKQPSPEKRQAALEDRRGQLRRLSQAGWV